MYSLFEAPVLGLSVAYLMETYPPKPRTVVHCTTIYVGRMCHEEDPLDNRHIMLEFEQIPEACVCLVAFYLVYQSQTSFQTTLESM